MGGWGGRRGGHHGADAIDVNLVEASDGFMDVLYNATLFLYRTKCEPVAATAGALLKWNIGKLVPGGWRL